MDTILRLTNGVRKVFAGLRPFNESVWPGARTDLFVAHESIYRFAATFAGERRVLDAGCGTGYGTAILASRASSALGVDLDRRSIDYARRRFGGPNVSFEVADLQKLSFVDAFDLVVASNSLEHLDEPGAFLRRAKIALRPSGLIIIAVPPIYGAEDAAVHADIHYHRSNLTVSDWHSLLVEEGLSPSGFVHRFIGAGAPDFASPRRSLLRPTDFSFTEVPGAELASTLSITAIFAARLPD